MLAPPQGESQAPPDGRIPAGEPFMSENASSSLNGAMVAPTRRRSRRGLSPFDRWVRAPLGLLWLGVMAVLAVPIILYMTFLYYIVQGFGPLLRARRRRRRLRDEA
jgi:hypothetical protein